MRDQRRRRFAADWAHADRYGEFARRRPRLGGRSAEIRFRYLGPSAETKPLASGEFRRQIGLKLRAQDTCNLVYAMWHIEPDAKLGVSVKRNPGKQTHEECHADGFVTIKPAMSTPL